MPLDCLSCPVFYDVLSAIYDVPGAAMAVMFRAY